jgi:phosphodiesterase/alkaline phosphatase D-like protein
MINGAANRNIQFIGNHFYGIGNRYYVVVGSSYGICGVFAGTQSGNITFDRNQFNNIGRLPTIGKIVSNDYTHDHGLYVLNGPHRIVNNIFYSNSAGWGVQISPGTINTVITNNTFQGANPQEDGLLMLWANNKTSPDTNITIQNNVFYGGRNYAIGNYQAYEVNTLIDHNIVFGSPSGLISQTGIGGTITETNNRINTDPVFTNLASYDFHLQGCSPAIDTGAAVVDPTDFEINPRPLGGAFDVGAYEYDSFNTPPAAAPDSLTANAVSSTGITLSWTNNAPTATNVLVESSTDNVNFTQIASLTCNAISFSDTGLTPNTQYYYRIRAANTAGTTTYPNTASATTFNLSAPSALVATAASGTSINLAWTNNSPNATAILVQDSADNVNFTTIATLAGTATSYASTGLTAGTFYYFRVQAQNGSGVSGYSNVASVTTSTPPPPPAAPMVLSATGTSATSISLTWKNNASNATAVLVEDSTDSVTFTQIASLGGKTTSYSSTGLTAGTLYYYRVRAQTAAGLSSYSSTGLRTGSTYYYRVRAQNGAGTPAYSNTSSATTLSAPAAPSALSATAASNSAYSNTASALTTGGSVPGAPSALVATPGSRGRIGLSWTNNSPNATASLVEDSTDNTTFTQIASLSGTATTYSGSGLKSGALYYFRVRAQNAVGTSGYSNTASATAP